MKIQCNHTEQGSGRQVCAHLLHGLDDSWSVEQLSHFRRFTGKGLDYVFTCPACREQPLSELCWVCGECFVNIAHGSRLGDLGQPEVAERPSNLQLQQVDRWPAESRLVQAVPFGKGWAALNQRNELVIVEAGRRRAHPLSKWEPGADEGPRLEAAEPLVGLSLSSGERCLLVDGSSGQLNRTLRREASPGCLFPLAFTPQGQLIHGTQPNRLELSEPGASGSLKILRTPKDYHQSSLSLSPGGHWLAMNGWIWQSMGEVRVLNLSEDGPSRPLCQRDGFWDGPLVWLGPSRLAVFGLGQIDVMLLPGVRIFDLDSQQELASIAGPDGPFAFDLYLFCHSPVQGFSVWDVETGQRVFHDPEFHPLAYHPGEKVFLSQPEGSLVISRLL